MINTLSLVFTDCLIPETCRVGGPSQYVLLVLQIGHDQFTWRTGTVSLRLQREHQTEGDHRQSKWWRSAITCPFRAMLWIFYWSRRAWGQQRFETLSIRISVRESSIIRDVTISCSRSDFRHPATVESMLYKMVDALVDWPQAAVFIRFISVCFFITFSYISSGSNVKPHSRSKWDSSNSLVLPPMPTTLVGICRLVQMYYMLSVS